MCMAFEGICSTDDQASEDFETPEHGENIPWLDTETIAHIPVAGSLSWLRTNPSTNFRYRGTGAMGPGAMERDENGFRAPYVVVLGGGPTRGCPSEWVGIIDFYIFSDRPGDRHKCGEAFRQFFGLWQRRRDCLTGTFEGFSDIHTRVLCVYHTNMVLVAAVRHINFDQCRQYPSSINHGCP